MKRYRNKTTGEIYIEGRTLTWQIDESTLWSGIPTEEQLTEWGFEEIITPQPTPAQKRMQEIKRILASMDYLTSKYVDGEDMSEYGDWQAQRKALRQEYRELESSEQTSAEE